MSVPSTIDHRATGYSLAHAYWLAKASDLAYKDEATIEEQARAWGFDRVRHHQTRFSPPFRLQDTQAYTAASDHMIVTAFRGTEPVQIKDWLSDATTPHRRAPGPVAPDSSTTASPTHWNRSAPTSRTPSRSTAPTARPAGSPATASAAPWPCSPTPAGTWRSRAWPRTACTPTVSPAPATDSWPPPTTRASRTACTASSTTTTSCPRCPLEPVYTHVSALRYIDSRGRLRESMPLLGSLTDRAGGLATDPLAPAGDGVRDHFINAYVTALEKTLA